MLGDQDRGAKQSEKGFTFFERALPMSNFHPSKFTTGDKQFTCVEIAYQYEKAMHSGGPNLAEKTLHMTQGSYAFISKDSSIFQ